MKSEASETPSEASSDPAVHQEHIRQELEKLIAHARADISRVNDARFQVLLESAVEVLTGLKTAVERFRPRKNDPWRDANSSAR